MTLLDLNNLKSIEERMPVLEETYAKTVGASVYDLCCHAAGVEPRSMQERSQTKVASVPVTAGGGLIGNFAEIVAAIVSEFAGVDAFTTEATDVAGLQEAVLFGADIVFLADDDVAMALNLHTGAQSDNSNATGSIFATLLECASGGVNGEDVLVLGAGKVGQAACRRLRSAGAHVFWHDTNPHRTAQVEGAVRCADWSSRQWRYIVECTTSPEIVRAEHLVPGAIVSAPGIPFGISSEACEKARMIIHDELESGVVTMLCEAMG